MQHVVYNNVGLFYVIVRAFGQLLHISRPNNVAICCVEILGPFVRGFMPISRLCLFDPVVTSTKSAF